MASQGDIARFKARISQLQRKRFQIMQYSEDPPRARLRGRVDDDRTRRKNAMQSRFSVPGAVWEIRDVWVDESGELHDEAADPAGDASSEPDAIGEAPEETQTDAIPEAATTASANETTEKTPRRKAASKPSV